jgi:AraC-like DNA-binding protein
MLYSPYFMMDRQDFIDKIVDQELYLVFATVGGIALVINGYYWFVCRQIILNYKAQYSKSHSYEQNLQYLSMAIYIMGACLAVWIFTGMVVVAGAILETDVTTLVEKSTDGIWLVFSTIPYFLGYYAIYQPEIFRLNQNITFLKPVDKGESLPDNVSNQVLQSGLSNVAANNLTIEESEAKLLQLRDKLESYMNEKKPYLNPRLTLIDLAENFQIHPNLLSRVINDCFQKNFFDYINTYRIEEFKRLIKDPKFENYTLLGVAFEVGFNSKTAFNRSFKKITNLTPSEYFYKVNGKVIEE